VPSNRIVISPSGAIGCIVASCFEFSA